VRVHRRPVHHGIHGIAGAALPTSVPTAAVAEPGDMPDEDLVRAEKVTGFPHDGATTVSSRLPPLRTTFGLARPVGRRGNCAELDSRLGRWVL
jgi:hypothetical protein